jgi:phenylpropionate dioxygenase-like ring-hydroxylating dioxygenase large terminal subunit
MTDTGNCEPHRLHVDFRRYYDPAHAEQELEKVWLKTWLFACREEDIPGVGDRVPFQVGRLSFFVIRSAADEFRAFYNSCLHRGTRLCSNLQSEASIRCPYHGWEWHLDGRLKRIPSHWDFKEARPGNAALREVGLGRWGGFIFINADPQAAPLVEALGPVPEHFHQFRIEDRHTAARFRKLVPANWKVVQEAFMESYHVLATHPEAVPYNGDSQTQYDIWSSTNGHVGRQITPSAVPSMHAPPEATTLQAGQVYASIMKAWHYPEAQLPELDGGTDIRAQISQWHRDVQMQTYGRSLDQTPDAVMLDSVLYFVFPHCTFWLSESLPFTYQFTPHPSDPNKSYFDVRLLLPRKQGEPRPPSAPAIEIAETERIQDKAAAFGFLAMVFDQDMTNMPQVQAGLQAADRARHHSHLGTYQEMIIQHWNDVLDRLMSA